MHVDAVHPILERRGLTYSAALIGPGSEGLGFDTECSTDHNRDPRPQLLVPDPGGLDDLLVHELPRGFPGYSTYFADDEGDRTKRMVADDGAVRRAVEIADVDTGFTARIGFLPGEAVSRDDWLTTPTQTLAELTGGAVFHDGLGRLDAVRATLTWYPDDVWREVRAGRWWRIAQEEAFVGRRGEVGDEFGSAIVAARLVRDLMRLCLLVARRYPPYSKWFGNAFARLHLVGTWPPPRGASGEHTWQLPPKPLRRNTTTSA
ncbi:DUF4037 domain-containing protein [Amycolatopsis sp. NPDC023774]|uniref:DUF4037 domain-containing protein n=1 Tax=Amycolatopsis sp. NPDC023774 TaxID=3155015 RepID=UPI0034041EAD